jgi:hypothetical protein
MRFMMENRTANGDEAVAWAWPARWSTTTSWRSAWPPIARQLCEWSPITLRLLKRGMVKSLETTDMEQQLRYEVVQHPHGLLQRGRQGGPQGLLREAQAGVPGGIAGGGRGDGEVRGAQRGARSRVRRSTCQSKAMILAASR